MTSMPGSAVRLHQVPALARPAARVVSWQPLAWVMAAGIAFVLMGSRAGVPLRLSIAAAAVAAASAFVLDDAAATTLAASPTSLPIRRVQRVTVATLAVGLWWIAAISIATHRAGPLPLQGPTLQLAVWVAVALAVSAEATTMGDRTAGGIAGAVVTISSFATTFLPPRVWLPFPAEPDGPGAIVRLLVVLVCAVTALAWVSRDPAQRIRRCRPGRAGCN